MLPSIRGQSKNPNSYLPVCDVVKWGFYSDPEYSLTPNTLTPALLIDGLNILAYAMAYAFLENITMTESERHVRLFRNGRNQALRIPREFELQGNEAIIRREGDRLIVEPIRKGQLLSLLSTLDSLDETFPDIDVDLAPLDDVTI